MKNVIIIGGNQIGVSLLDIIDQSDSLEIIGIVEPDEKAPIIEKANNKGIKRYQHWLNIIDVKVDVVIETTGNEELLNELHVFNKNRWVIIPFSLVTIISNLIQERDRLIFQLSEQSIKQQLLLDSTHDGMIAIDTNEIVTLFNRSAERMVGIKATEAIGKKISKLIPSSGLPRILQTGDIELNLKQELENGTKIITTRIPLISEDNQLIGAFAVFQNITDVVNLAKEVTNLKSIESFLKAIIQSSQEAITVVDAEGKGLMINAAYTNITGLTEEDVIGKPATIDISEGESVHMQVLQTRKPVRGARLRVGPKQKEVYVNVAPVIVDGVLKGSVGVIRDISEISALSEELQRARQIIRNLEAKYTFNDIIGNSEELKFAIEQAKLSAKTTTTVLIRGESGTGKELFAHAIHNESERKFNKFVKVNCATYSETQLEQVLFGYVDNTGSNSSNTGKKGLFEEANGGSLFLDEVGEMTKNTQAKLLRILQEKQLYRVGGTEPIPIDVRVIAATNTNLEKSIFEGSFRKDLYYRINKMPIHIPPLRDRKNDMKELCHWLIQKLNQEYGRNISMITDEAIAYLQTYEWPGNVRELENVLANVIIHLNFNEKRIKKTSLSKLEQQHGKLVSNNEKELRIPLSSEKNLNEHLEAFEKQVIKNTLEVNNGNKTKAAKSLGISLRNLYYKLEKYNLD